MYTFFQRAVCDEFVKLSIHCWMVDRSCMPSRVCYTFSLRVGHRKTWDFTRSDSFN